MECSARGSSTIAISAAVGLALATIVAAPSALRGRLSSNFLPHRYCYLKAARRPRRLVTKSISQPSRNPRRMNTCKSASKQRTLTPFVMCHFCKTLRGLPRSYSRSGPEPILAAPFVGQDGLASKLSQKRRGPLRLCSSLNFPVLFYSWSFADQKTGLNSQLQARSTVRTRISR